MNDANEVCFVQVVVESNFGFFWGVESNFVGLGVNGLDLCMVHKLWLMHDNHTRLIIELGYRNSMRENGELEK